MKHTHGLWNVPLPSTSAQHADAHRSLEKPRGFPTRPTGPTTTQQGVGPFCFITVGSFYVVKTTWYSTAI